jgi:hypothetical protein
LRDHGTVTQGAHERPRLDLSGLLNLPDLSHLLRPSLAGRTNAEIADAADLARRHGLVG